jgi:hypothetical protein
MFKLHWVMYCINLVHSRIDIFDINHWKPQDVLELHDKLKDKMQLINDALCRATEWKEKKMSNIAWFKLPFSHVHDRVMRMTMHFLRGRTLNTRTETHGHDR